MSRAYAASVAESRWRQRVTLRRVMELEAKGASKVDAAAQAMHELTGEPLPVCRAYAEKLRAEGNALAEAARKRLEAPKPDGAA